MVKNQNSANSGGKDHAKVAIESINIVLKNGQTHIHDGYHLSSNAHGALFINVSYFMPFAYRVFKKLDPNGAAVWNKLLDKTYQDLKTSLNLTLHDLNANKIVGNGQLFPNWYQLSKATGQPIDIVTQTENTNVRGYQFGYDAFRTIWFLAYDDHLYGKYDSRSRKILAKVYQFFKQEMNQKGKIAPVYNIDGTHPPEHNYEASFGFYAVYLNLFKLMGDKQNERAILKMYSKHRGAKGGRVWIKDSDPKFKGGMEEYFMNLWAFFGVYLYTQ